MSSLRFFFKKYVTLYIKPDYGFQGRGVIKATKTSDGYKYIKERGRAVQCSSLQELYRKVKQQRTQVVQKGVPVATIAGRPFDIRLLMMRNKYGEWQYAGMLAKVAGEGWVITNKRSNGYVLTVDVALKRSLNMSSHRISVAKHKMVWLCYEACRKIDKYNRYKQIGFDLAVDRQGLVWMIEQNTDPGWSLFRQLQDKTMYKKIYSILQGRK